MAELFLLLAKGEVLAWFQNRVGNAVIHYTQKNRLPVKKLHSVQCTASEADTASSVDGKQMFIID